jgi:nucleotide-binding universal stress UspA family protein
MPQVKKILFPTDFSELSRQGYLYCLQLAKQFGASVEVLHVYRSDINIPSTVSFGNKMLHERQRNIILELGKFAKLINQKEHQHLLEDVQVSRHTYLGLPDDGISDYAAMHEIDLIVMPTKGEHNLVEVLMGSNTIGTIGKANCPVLIIPENCQFTAFKNMVYTTDLSYDNTDNIEMALKFAKLYNSNINYLYVYKEDPAVEWRVDEILMKNYENLDVWFHQIKNDQIELGLKDFLAQNPMDLVVTYSPQKNFIERFLHFSVTRHIVEQIKKPILVLK